MPASKPFQKEQELIAVGASIAAGCQPCTVYHVRAALAAGAAEDEIRQAGNIALDVRHGASEIMARLLDRHLGNEPAPATAASPGRSLLGELVAVGAALAVNCVTNLKEHLTAARQLGAADCHIQTVLSIARAVKEMAGKKAEAVAAQAMQASEECPDDCACHDNNDEPSAKSADCACGPID